MTLFELISAAGSSGIAVASLGLLGLGTRIYAWRMRARDIRLYREALLAAGTDPERRAVLALNPPPPLTDQILKIAAVVYISGMAVAAAEPTYKVVTAARTQSSAARGKTPQPAEQEAGQARLRREHPRVGPQSATEAFMATSRWTDGTNPFERLEEGQ